MRLTTRILALQGDYSLIILPAEHDGWEGVNASFVTVETQGFFPLITTMRPNTVGTDSGAEKRR